MATTTTNTIEKFLADWGTDGASLVIERLCDSIDNGIMPRKAISDMAKDVAKDLRIALTELRKRTN